MKGLRRLGLPLALVALVLPVAVHADEPFDEPGVAGAYLAARQALLAPDYTAAAPYLALVLEHDADNPGFLEGATQVHLALGEMERAVAFANRFEATGLQSQVVHLVLLTDALDRGDYREAAVRLADEVSVGPLVAGLLRGWIRLDEGRMSETLAGFEALSRERGMQAFALYHRALALALAGDFEGAEQILSGAEAGPIRVGRRGVIARLQVLSHLDRHEDALVLLEDAFGADQSPDIAQLRRALEAGEQLGPDIAGTARHGMAEVFFDVASTLRGEASPEYVLMYTRLALALRPDHAAATLLAAQQLDAMEQHALAVRVYDSIAEDVPMHYLAQIGRAEALYRDAQVDEALETLRSLAEGHEQVAGVHLALADMLRRESQFDAAAEAYDRVIALLGEPQPGHWSVYFSRAITHEREGRWDEAEADFRQALALNPEQPLVLNYLGYSLVERREQLEEALDMIERAVAGDPESGHITDSLGWALYRLGRYEEAVAPMERAVELLPRDPILNDHLGDVYWAVGRKLEAEFQWRRALSFGPADDLDMERIRRKLEVGLDQVLIEEGAEPHHAVPAN